MSNLSELPAPAIEPERLARLRLRAASTLTGAAATKGAAARATDALSVLHALASSPDTAADALTLLHELQVHQVELDLQALELQESRAELETALRRQNELYDGQPVGCFTIDPQMALQEMNQTGADMLGLPRDDALGLSLEAFFSAEGGPRWRSAISGVDAGKRRTSCRLMLRRKGGADRPVVASVGKDPAAKRYLVSLTEDPDALPQAR